MAQIIDGKAIAAACRERIAAEAERCRAAGVVPGLAVVQVGEDAASAVYVGQKTRMCEQLGLYSEQHTLPQETTQPELLRLLDRLAAAAQVHGILVQLPLPAQIDEKVVLAAIPPGKDVDVFHPASMGAIMSGGYHLRPCTPAAVIELLDAAGIEVAGKECVVVGRSNIVGKPVALLLLQRNATVTICHSRTADLNAVCQRADILVAAAGRARMITADMVKPGAAVIDVGINRDDSGKLCGDVDFEAVKEVAGWITPVPGGVGPMTIAMLMQNTVAAARLAAGLR